VTSETMTGCFNENTSIEGRVAADGRRDPRGQRV
jgi:hypothetical protein